MMQKEESSFKLGKLIKLVQLILQQA